MGNVLSFSGWARGAGVESDVKSVLVGDHGGFALSLVDGYLVLNEKL